MSPRDHHAAMNRARAMLALIALVGLLGLAAETSAQLPTRFTEIAKWAVSYQDRQLGIVEGVAFCDWDVPRCRVKVRDPRSGAIHVLRADGVLDIRRPGRADEPLAIVLHPPASAGGAPRVADANRGINADHGETAKITMKSGDTEMEVAVQVRSAEKADRDLVRLSLDVQPDGSLVGRWRYLANPQTERDAAGGGRLGMFRLLNDGEIPVPSDALRRPGGFLGEQSGGEGWLPLPPRVLAVMVLEDQAAFDDGVPKFRHAWGSDTRKENVRTLVIVGHDLPVDDGRPVVPLFSKDAGVSYELVAVAGADGTTPEQAQQFERAWRTLTRPLPPVEAADFRRLDAVMVKATLTREADAGPKTLTWAATGIGWTLQYGDNTAEVRFVRVFNETESEATATLVVPERVVVEVHTGGPIQANAIPVRVAIAGTSGGVIDLPASKVPGRADLFRTAPIVFAAGVDRPPGATAGDRVIAAGKSARILAGVDRTKTHFLRAEVAVASARGPSDRWLNALKRAAACERRQFDDWPRFARTPAQTLTLKRQSVDINYGDHAAMLILRDAFLEVQRGLLQQVARSASSDDLVDAWYRSMHAVVTGVADFPLSVFEVNAPAGGTVPFRVAYSWNFMEASFRPFATADGFERYREWRRTVSRQALAEYRRAVAESLAKVEAIDDCAREELLKLTGSGFGSIRARIEPLFMRDRPDDGLFVPDRLARAYVRGLDVLAERLRAMEEFSSLVNQAIASGVGVAVGLPALAWSGPAALLASFAGGFAIYVADSAVAVYDTYQQYEEVRFEFGASGSLGLERYFDAKSRQTEWWQTAASIFGQGLLQAAGAHLMLDEPLFEGLALWHGQRAFARVERGGLEAARRLSDLERRHLAFFMMKERERLALSPVIPYRTRYVARVFEDLGHAAAGGVPVSETLPTVRAIEAQAAGAAHDLKAPPAVDPFREAKTVASQTALIEGAGTAVSGSGLNTAAREAAFAGKAKFYKNLPPPNHAWTVEINGQKVTFDVGEVLGQGAFFTVYELRTPPIGLRLDPDLGDRVVLKVLNDPEVLAEFNAQVPGIADRILRRMKNARQLLKQIGVRQLEFQGFEDAGIIVQKQFEKKPGAFELFSRGADFRAADKAQGGALGRALARLYDRIGAGNVVWLDGHLNNVFFEKVGGEWVAGVLDQDFICTFAELNGGTVYENYLLYLRMHPMMLKANSIAMPGDLRYSTARSVMHKMLEHKAWLNFDLEKRVLSPKLLDPQEVQQVIRDLPHVPKPPPRGSWLRPHHPDAPPLRRAA